MKGSILAQNWTRKTVGEPRIPKRHKYSVESGSLSTRIETALIIRLCFVKSIMILHGISCVFLVFLLKPLPRFMIGQLWWVEKSQIIKRFDWPNLLKFHSYIDFHWPFFFVSWVRKKRTFIIVYLFESWINHHYHPVSYFFSLYLFFWSWCFFVTSKKI